MRIYHFIHKITQMPADVAALTFLAAEKLLGDESPYWELVGISTKKKSLTMRP